MKRPKRDRRAQRWTPLQPATLIPMSEARAQALLDEALRLRPDLDIARYRERLVDQMKDAGSGRWWKNDRYTVIEKEWSTLNVNGREVPVVWLSIRRNDRAPIRDWRDLQRIKNELIGPDCEAVELFPAEERLTDCANQFHLWAMRDATFRFPFGFFDGRIISGKSAAGAVQRPFD
jgi:hypothetical protein